MLPIVIYLLVIYLVYKGIEITQIAYVSTADSRRRAGGIVLGVLCIIAAVGIGIVAVAMTSELSAFTRFP